MKVKALDLLPNLTASCIFMPDMMPYSPFEMCMFVGFDEGVNGSGDSFVSSTLTPVSLATFAFVVVTLTADSLNFV